MRVCVCEFHEMCGFLWSLFAVLILTDILSYQVHKRSRLQADLDDQCFCCISVSSVSHYGQSVPNISSTVFCWSLTLSVVCLNYLAADELQQIM